jgi:hypothetical protein
VVILFKDDETVMLLFGLLLGSLSIFVLLFTCYYPSVGVRVGVEPIPTPAKEAWSSVLILEMSSLWRRWRGGTIGHHLLFL